MTLRRSWRAALLLLLSACMAFADEAAIRFEEANQAYRSGNFAAAAHAYEQILAQGYESAELHYNLGNSYYKQNRIPAAILQYERALKLAPDDEDILHNLSLANLRITDRIEPLPELFLVTWWKQFVTFLPADGWAWMGLISLWAALASAALLLSALRPWLLRRIAALVALAGITLFLASLAGMLGRARLDAGSSYAILQSPSVHVRSAPDERSTGLFVLHEGVKLQLLDSVSGWTRIKLADGKTVWVPTSAFESI
jgi:tetratricopeptide (TPR) repeat protein